MSAPFQRPLWLFWLGAGAGLTLAIASLVLPQREGEPRALPDGAVAIVNGQPILRADYDGALRELSERERRRPTQADKRRALDRLIAEELMIEHGEQLGLVRADDATRHAIVAAVLASERAPHAARIPSDAELQAFYESIRGELARPGKLHVRQLLFRVGPQLDLDTARAHAESARARLAAGEAFAGVRAALASTDEPELPDQPLTLDQLRAQIGPVALSAVLELQPGQVSAVLGSSALLRVLLLVDKPASEVPALAEVREQVILRYQHHAAERALEVSLAARRKAAEVRSLEPLP